MVTANVKYTIINDLDRKLLTLSRSVAVNIIYYFIHHTFVQYKLQNISI